MSNGNVGVGAAEDKLSHYIKWGIVAIVDLAFVAMALFKIQVLDIFWQLTLGINIYVFGDRFVKGLVSQGYQAGASIPQQITTTQETAPSKPASAIVEEKPTVAWKEEPDDYIPTPNVSKPNAFAELPKDMVDKYGIAEWSNKAITNPAKMPEQLTVGADETPDMAVSVFFSKQADEVFKLAELEVILKDTMCSQPQIHADVWTCWKIARDNWISYALELYYDR